MTYCQNCGHESHCHTPLEKEMLDGDIIPIKVVVCAKCRCENCWRPDWG